jgi:hypothetical protein
MQDAVADSMAARFGRSLSSDEKAAQGRFVAHLLELVHVRVPTQRVEEALMSPDRPGLCGWDMAGISPESERKAGLSRSETLEVSWTCADTHGVKGGKRTGVDVVAWKGTAMV